jgi:sugar O-acyltransferase (sialic acid O-acetyltransferase NeuD family)
MNERCADIAAGQMRKILIFGTGDMGELCHLLLTEDAGREVAAFTVEARFRTGAELHGLPVVPFESVAATHPPDRFEMLVALGPGERNRLRARVFAAAAAMGYGFASYIHSTVKLHGSATMGRNCLVFENVALQPWTRLGDNVVVRPLAYVGHHAVIGDHGFVAPHASLLGHSSIGERGFVGAGAVIGPRVELGRDSIIGANAAVMSSLPARSVVRPGAAPGFDGAGAARNRQPRDEV